MLRTWCQEVSAFQSLVNFFRCVFKHILRHDQIPVRKGQAGQGLFFTPELLWPGFYFMFFSGPEHADLPL